MTIVAVGMTARRRCSACDARESGNTIALAEATVPYPAPLHRCPITDGAHLWVYDDVYVTLVHLASASE